MSDTGVKTSSLIADIKKAATPIDKLLVGLPSVLDFMGIMYEKDPKKSDHLQSMITGIRKKLETEWRTIPHNTHLAEAMRVLYLEVSGVSNRLRTTPQKLVNYNPYSYLRDLSDYLQVPEYTELDKEIIEFARVHLVKGWFTGYSRVWNVFRKDTIQILKKYVGVGITEEVDDTTLCEKILESINSGSRVWEYLSRILSACEVGDSVFRLCSVQIESDNRGRPHRSDRKFFSETMAK